MKVLVTQNRRGIGDLIIFIPYIFYISERLGTPVSLLVRKNCKASQILSEDKSFYVYIVARELPGGTGELTAVR